MSGPDRSTEISRLRQELERHHRTLIALENAAARRTAGNLKVVELRTVPRPTRRRASDRDFVKPWNSEGPQSWPASAWPAEPIEPSPGFACATVAGGQVTVTAFPVFGLSNADLTVAVERVDRLQRRSMAFIPIFLTDSSAHRIFSQHGYAFEYFPSTVYRTAEGHLDRDRIEARLRLLWRKWNVAASIDFSAPADQVAVPKPSIADVADSRRRSRIDRLAAKIRASGLFDEDWYLRVNPDVAGAGIDPVIHYLQDGVTEGRDPHPLFRTDFYAQQMLDALTRGKRKA